MKWDSVVDKDTYVMNVTSPSAGLLSSLLCRSGISTLHDLIKEFGIVWMYTAVPQI